jgi:carboxypeptidase C (cathepsin A)
MHKQALKIILLAVVVIAGASAADAAGAAKHQPFEAAPQDEMAVTHNQVVIGGKPLRYTTRTGLIPIYDDATGTLMARMFVMAYMVERAPGQKPRPLTFLWNGGPGANSSESHLVGFGPKGYVTPATFPEWTSPPSKIADRPETLLTVSDLVFVDPIGTGYSRAVTDADRDILYTTHGDGEAVAEMIRVYRTRYDAFDQPLFISGESYGTTRAMEVAWALTRRRTPLAGVVLISGFYDLGQKVPHALQQALDVPMFTATAHYFKRLPPDLQGEPRDQAMAEATQWARSEYAPALDAVDSLTPDQRGAIAAKLARYTGLAPRFIDQKTLVVSKDDDLDRLLDDRGLELGRYDSRLAIARRDLSAAPWLPTRDPSILPVLDMMQGTSPSEIRYLRGTLGYRSDLLYKGPFGEGFHPAPIRDVIPGISDDWMTLMWDRKTKADAAAQNTPPPDPDLPKVPPGAKTQEEPPLRRAMEAEPGMSLMNVRGLYDSSCAGLDEAVARTDPALRVRVRNKCYPSGHAFYTDAEVRRDYQRDFAEFVRQATTAP